MFCGGGRKVRKGDSLDSLCGDSNQLVVKLVVIHRKSNRRNESEPLIPLLIADHLSAVGKSDRVGHVNGDGVSVSEGDDRCEFECGGPSVSECDDSV